MCRCRRADANVELPSEQPVIVQYLVWEDLACEMSFEIQITLPAEQQAHLKWEVPAHLKWELPVKGQSKCQSKSSKSQSECHLNVTSKQVRTRLGVQAKAGRQQFKWELRTRTHSRRQFMWELRNTQSQEQFMGKLQMRFKLRKKHKLRARHCREWFTWTSATQGEWFTKEVPTNKRCCDHLIKTGFKRIMTCLMWQSWDIHIFTMMGNTWNVINLLRGP